MKYELIIGTRQLVECVTRQDRENALLRQELAGMVVLMTSHLVGLSEIATMLGVHRQQITLWRRKGSMPEPAAVLQGNRPVWYRSDIVAWAAENKKEILT